QTITLSTKLNEIIVRLLMDNNLIKTKNEVASVHASDNNRSEKVNHFREKSLYCLITTTILEKVVTFPSFDDIVIQTDNKVFNSAGLIKISSRVCRSVKDPKRDVYFIINNNTEAIQKSLKDLRYMNKLAKEDRL